MEEEKELEIEPNDEAKKIIADIAAKYLRTRMEISRELKIKEGKKPISYAMFKEEMKIRKSDYSRRRYMLQNKGNILFSDEEIDELVSLVHESLSNYTPLDSSFFGLFSYLVTDALDTLAEHTTDEEKVKRIKQWRELAFCDQKYGIDERLEGRFEWDTSDNEFVLHDSNFEMTERIGFDGTDLMIANNREKHSENILLNDNLYFGKVIKEDGENINTILLKKEEDGQTLYTAVGYDGKTYPNDICYIFQRMDEFLDRRDLSFLKKHFYTQNQIYKIIDASINYPNMSDEEKEKIDTLADKASDWWMTKVSDRDFDEDRIKGKNTAQVAEIIRRELGKLKDFKKYLGYEIKAELISKPYEVNIGVDYHPDEILTEATRRANIECDILTFPSKTKMSIIDNLIKVREGQRSLEEVIYDANQLNNQKTYKKEKSSN